MEVITLIIAVIALVVAVAAFARAGGLQDVRHRLETLNVTAESAREKAANALDRLERLVRGREKPAVRNEEPR
jgi:hypothetical protein